MAITVYSKPGCVQCNFTKKYFDNNGVDYISLDVTESEEAMKTVVDLGFQALPVVVADGKEPFTGYRPDLLEEIVEGV